MCKYADDLSQLCPQHTDTTLEEEYIHIQRWADCNKLLINTSKTKEILFQGTSLRQYVPPPSITHIEQIDHVMLFGVFFTSTLTTSTHINSVIAVMNQWLYLLNQLRKQGLDIRGLTQIFIDELIIHQFPVKLLTFESKSKNVTFGCTWVWVVMTCN